MAITVKNWKKFQHFKERFPPWIKLHRRLLMDREIHALPGDDFKILTMIWLSADEHGLVPELEDLAFELRMDVAKLSSHIAKLGHWLISDCPQDDITPIAREIHDDIPTISPSRQDGHSEKRRVKSKEKSKEKSLGQNSFDEFWTEYPRKVKKLTCRRIWKKLAPDEQLVKVVMQALGEFKASHEWTKDEGQFIPQPTSWLNQKRWEDEGLQAPTQLDQAHAFINRVKAKREKEFQEAETVLTVVNPSQEESHGEQIDQAAQSPELPS